MRARFTYRGHNLNERVLRDLLSARPGTPLGEDLDSRARRVERLAKQLVGVDTTRLIRSIRRERGEGFVDIVAGIPGQTPYTMWHHDGTRPHIVRPRRAKALRFVVNGRVVYAARVRHPGTRGSRFLTRALSAAV